MKRMKTEVYSETNYVYFGTAEHENFDYEEK